MVSNQASNSDSGIQNHRVEFVRESTTGTVPADPEWNLYSDTIETALVVSSDAQIEGQRGVGDVNNQNFFAGPEDHSASIDYHLQNFFVDGSGDPLDAAGDAIVRDADNQVNSTHSILDRYEAGNGTRVYRLAKGAYPNVGDISGDPGTALPIVISLDYEAKKIRSYKMAQPSSETLEVVSTSADDTTQTLTIESDGASTSADVSLNGTTAVTTTDSFDSIDAFELDAETEGDVIINDSSGNELGRIRGSDYYNGVEGDLGVPALGSGSRASAIGSSYERFLDDDVKRGGSSLAVEIRSASASITNNYSKTAVAGTKCQAIHEGVQDGDLSATIAGDFVEHDDFEDHLAGNELDVVWNFAGGDLTFSNAALTDLGDVGPSAGDVISTQDNTFMAGDISVSSN